MSLPSYFYRCPPELNINALEVKFRVINYVQTENYRLIGWTSAAAAGEILYRDKVCLTAIVGSIELMPAEVDASDPWSDAFSSPLGLSMSTIKSLKSQTPQVIYSQ
jgi:hypothetical protein